LLLHARELKISHPITAQPLTFTAELEGHIKDLFVRFNWLQTDTQVNPKVE
jgi:hypothetical protein